MKKITVSVDEKTCRLSRIKAAEAGTSVTALLRDHLFELVQGRIAQTRFNGLRRLQDETLEAIRTRRAGLNSRDNLLRGALHDRDTLP